MSSVQDIFGYKRNPKPRGVFSSEESMLTFGGGSITNPIGYLVQQWNANYQQDVRELFELGSAALYWVKGRPVGQGTIGRIIGEAAQPGKFLPAEAYDICNGGASMSITSASGMCDNAGDSVSIRMDGVVVTAVGFGMTVQEAMVQENLQWRFAAMQV